MCNISGLVNKVSNITEILDKVVLYVLPALKFDDSIENQVKFKNFCIVILIKFSYLFVQMSRLQSLNLWLNENDVNVALVFDDYRQQLMFVEFIFLFFIIFF